MNKTLKWGLIIIGIISAIWLAFYISLIIATSLAFDSEGRFYTAEELRINFREKQSQIYQLKHYFNSVVPKNKSVSIEFDSDDEIGRLSITYLTTFKGVASHENYTDWNLTIGSKKLDSVINTLGWKRTTLSRIKELLDKADCIGVESGEPSILPYKRAGFGMYSYVVFDNPMPDSTKLEFDRYCGTMYINPRLALKWDTGAIGSECLPEK